MREITSLLILLLSLTGCLEVTEKIGLHADGSASIDVTMSLDKEFIRGIARADAGEGAFDREVIRQELSKEFEGHKKDFTKLPSFGGYTTSSEWGSDSSLIMHVNVAMLDMKQLPKYHSVFWDIDKKKRSNDPTTFPLIIDLKKKKNVVDFSFKPHSPTLKNGAESTADEKMAEAFKGKYLTIEVEGATGITSKSANAEQSPTGALRWQLPMMEAFNGLEKPFIGKASFKLK